MYGEFNLNAHFLPDPDLVVSLPRVWPHRDCDDRVHGTVGQKGWDFGVCWTAYTWCSGEVTQARWDIRRARGTGRVGGL